MSVTTGSDFKARLNKQMIYIFHRGDMFYPLVLGSDDEAVANAQCNPGTTKVTLIGGELIWPLPKHRQ